MISEFENFFVGNHIIYHDSFDDLLANKKPSRRQNLRCWIKSAMFVLFFIKSLVFMFYNDPSLYERFGDSFHLIFSKFTYIYALFVCVLSLGIIAKLFVTYCESRPGSGLHCVVELMVGLRSRHPNYRLNLRKQKKLVQGSNILFWLYIKIIGNSITGCVIGIYFVVCFVNYIYNYDKFNIIMILLNSFYFSIIVKHLISLVLSGSFIFYLPITYLNFKFDELIDILHNAIRCEDKTKLLSIIRFYNELTR